MTNTEEFLQHYGKKGMKWGVRNKVEQVRSKAIKTAKTNIDSKKRERSWGKQYKTRGQMSNAELRKRINRLKMENEFAKLAGEASAGQRKMAKKAIRNISHIPVNAKGDMLKSVVASKVKKAVATAAVVA